MTVSAIGPSLADPLGSVFALPRMAMRVQPVRGVDAVAGRRPDDVRSSDDGDAFAAPLEVEDVVELSGPHGAQELNEEEQAQVRELKSQDQQVRQHEAAHQAGAGAYASGGANYTYETGPDGRRYAVGGEVQIDTSPEPDDPEATIRKLQQVRAAALAPAEPSGQDRQVAAQATSRIQQAQAELSAQRTEKHDVSERRGSAVRAYETAYAEPRFVDTLA